MSDEVKAAPEESAPIQEEQKQPTLKEAQEAERQRKGYINHMKKQNEVLEVEVENLKLSLDKHRLNTQVIDLNQKMKEAQDAANSEATTTDTPKIEVVKNAQTS